MLTLYRWLALAGTPVLKGLLQNRVRRGKEYPERVHEKRGIPTHARPSGRLVWLHAASMGEARSALILISALLEKYPDIHVLVTTVTVTSAEMMATALPKRAFHQFYPLDHPVWIKSFLYHWQPDFALWMESELWPCMLGMLKEYKIPAVLVNARLSPRSHRRWRLGRALITPALQSFRLILAQTDEAAALYKDLGADHVTVTGNLKYSAAPLPYDPEELDSLRKAVRRRPLWLYASTHEGEEELACRLHKKLKKDLPGLLTIIVPRHPERRQSIADACKKAGLSFTLRGESRKIPAAKDDIYIADTLGELGLFYRLAPLACIGRSFSNDGGGGHNPLEAAQLGCAVLHGPRVQNLQDIYDAMKEAGALSPLADEKEFYRALKTLLSDGTKRTALQDKAHAFSREKGAVLSHVMEELEPLLDKAGFYPRRKPDHSRCA